jgi:hypothetical protein
MRRIVQILRIELPAGSGTPVLDVAAPEMNRFFDT